MVILSDLDNGRKKSSKKVPKMFGGDKKSLYLCIRFRERRTAVLVERRLRTRRSLNRFHNTNK